MACAELMPSFPTKGVRSESVKERCKELGMNVKLTDKQLELMSKGEHVDEDLGLCVPGSSAPTTEKKVKEEMPSKALISEELKAFKKAYLITRAQLPENICIMEGFPPCLFSTTEVSLELHVKSTYHFFCVV